MKYFIFNIGGIATGGIELLHQLAYTLRIEYHKDAYLYFDSNYLNEPLIHPEYEMYQNRFVLEIEDNEDNFLIVPEIFKGVETLSKYKKIKKIIWWLSVDNHGFKFNKLNTINKFLVIVNKVTLKVFSKKFIDRNNILMKIILRYPKKYVHDNVFHCDYHFAQSKYSIDFLKKIGVDHKSVFFLSDFLNESFINESLKNNEKKQNIVLYNPKKGITFTQKVIKVCSGINFVPIINLSRKEVIDLLCIAKVYIDFGNHPGKDRFPREAAVLDCIIITNKTGSAKFYDDVSIKDYYKIHSSIFNLFKICRLIKHSLINYDSVIKEFSVYNHKILSEKKKFSIDLNQIINIIEKE